MYPIIEEKLRFHRDFTSSQAEFSSMGSNLYTGGIFVDGSNLYTGGIFVDGSNLYTGGTKFSKNGGASPPRTAFVHVPNFDQNRNFFFNPGLYTGGVFMLSSNLYTG
ncbi:hypothetical protein TNCV_422241 [Trichonephila clavipes]|nr:hypothetical protein TNCV_422241 [Trichonephila clavipes]